MKLKKVWKLIALMSLIFLLISCGKKKEEKPLVMGLSPIANSEKLLEDAAPLYKMLGDDIGRPVEGYIATNYIGVVEALGTGTIDFALIPPFAYILANKKNGSEALLTSIGKNDEPGYYSVLLVRTDSGIEKVEDLKGKKVAVKLGTQGATYAESIKSKYGFTITTFEDSSSMYQDVIVGNSDALFEDYPVLAYSITSNNLPLKMTDHNENKTEYGVAVNKGENAELITAFNNGLKNSLTVTFLIRMPIDN